MKSTTKQALAAILAAAEDGEGGENERGGFHDADSTTDGDGRKEPAAAAPATDA